MNRLPDWDETSKLVVLGRDRDAADRHVVDAHQASELENRVEDPVDTIQQLDAVLPLLEEIASNVRPDQMANATPCAEFDVRGVFNHMIGGAGFFAAQLRGEAPPDPAPEGADLTGDDAGAAFTAAIDALDDAIREPGALERTIVAPFGQVPGAVIARFVALDGMVHAWDLATATGQSYDPPEQVVVEVLAFARQAIAPEMRGGGAFEAEVPAPPGATPFQQLIAFTGRTV